MRATVSRYLRGRTEHIEGRIISWHGGRRATVETDDGERVTGLVVNDVTVIDGTQP